MLRAAESWLSKPFHLVEIALARADLRDNAGDELGASQVLTTFLAASQVVSKEIRKRVLEKLLVVWPAARAGLRPWGDEYYAMIEGADEPDRTGGMAICMGALARVGDHARAVELAHNVDLVAARAKLPPSLHDTFDLAFQHFALLVEQFRHPS